MNPILRSKGDLNSDRKNRTISNSLNANNN
jgi:hypothetical protein